MTMKASIIDLRYKMNRILKSLERNESVTILYHGKEKGVLFPKRIRKDLRVMDHPFFGMMKNEVKSVSSKMENLRGGRFNAL